MSERRNAIPAEGWLIGALLLVTRSTVELMSLLGLLRLRETGTLGAWWKSAKRELEGGIDLLVGVLDSTFSGRKIEAPSGEWVVMKLFPVGRPDGWVFEVDIFFED
jgi:hypothetical protein